MLTTMEPEYPDAKPPRGAPCLVDSEGVAELLLAGHSVQVKVRGKSMTPRIPDGTLLTLEPLVSTTLPRIGDIVLYRSNIGRLVCHRLLARRGTARFGFRGDAFTCPLEWVEASRLLGKAIRRDGARIDTPVQRWSGLAQAWWRWSLGRTRIRMGSWKRRLFTRPASPTP